MLAEMGRYYHPGSAMNDLTGLVPIDSVWQRVARVEERLRRLSWTSSLHLRKTDGPT